MHIAQLNIAKAKAPLDSPIMFEFVENLVPINQIADASAGFIWHLQDESGDATAVKAFDDPTLLVNMSVWVSIEALKSFMSKTHHLSFLQRKTLWFNKADGPNHVLWWVPEGHIPSLAQAKQRLEALKSDGETEFAFSFRKAFLES